MGIFLDLCTFFVREYAVQFPAEDFDCGNLYNEEIILKVYEIYNTVYRCFSFFEITGLQMVSHLENGFVVESGMKETRHSCRRNIEIRKQPRHVSI
jgi:hypothetical protein